MPLPNRGDLENRGNIPQNPSTPEELLELAKSKSKAALQAIIQTMDDTSVPATARMKAAELVLEIANDKDGQFTSQDQEKPFERMARMIQEAKRGYTTLPPDTTPQAGSALA